MNNFTAQADSWGAAMTRGQQPSSAPRYPGQDNEFFNAPAAAWRESMTAGQVPAASVADDHGGMTHKCDGCSDGAPCGSCGGNVSRASPAYQAFGWGMMQAASNGMTDPFWKAATVAHALSTAPGRTNSADWNALESMVNRTQALYTVGTQGMNAAGALLGAWKDGEFPVPSSTPVDPDLPYIPVTTTPANRGFCCAQLIYPVPHPKEDEKRFDDGSMLWFTEFEGLAVYSNDDPCQCDCCYFRQYINTKMTGSKEGSTDMPLGPEGKLPYTFVGEDRDRHGNKFGRDGNPRKLPRTPSCKEHIKGKSCEDKSPGPVSSIPSTLPPHIRDLLLKMTKGMSSFCYYYLRDNPGVRVAVGETKHRSDCFHGIVRTRCPKCAVKAEGSFSLYVGGKVSKSGVPTRFPKRNEPHQPNPKDQDKIHDKSAPYLPGVFCTIPEAEEGCGD